ncbi:MAG TPA: hypothetical protein VD970_01900 [Acetobacteraceae bacterium]|nr:hypothetical protein [Acetobacteraceae bacterium]
MLLLLAYVEAECRRIGATEAAGLAARTALAIEDACGATPPQHGLPGLTH